VIETMKTTAEETQGPLLDYLSEDERVKEKESYHIINLVYARVTNDLAEELEDEELQEELGIDYVFPDFEIELTQSNEPASRSSRDHVETQSDSIEWNIEQINAPAVWDLGIDGSGVVVGVIDSGVTWEHEALQRKWRGYDSGGNHDPTYSWYDVHDDADMPYDPYGIYIDDDGNFFPVLGHGTHVTGTILGSDPAENNRIGVAPGAKWIAAKIFEDETGEGGHSGQVTTFRSSVEGGEWMLEPGGDPGKAPDIINNSWGSSYLNPPSDNEALRELEVKWRDAQIFPVDAAGNSGPGGSREPTDEEGITYPATFEEAFAVGATDSDKNIAGFSSRGPGVDGCVKPDLVAPGSSISSAATAAIHGGGYYRVAQGTSMAAPHVAGVAALLLEADPSLSPGEIEEILIDTAEPLTDSDYPDHPNNAYGYGLVDAYAAVKSLGDPPDPDPSLSFTSLTPSSFHTSSSPYDAELTAKGSNFKNVEMIRFVWEGDSGGGSSNWYTYGLDWAFRVEVISDNEMTIRPEVVEAGATWSGTDTWTVTMRDDSWNRKSQTFTVTYDPSDPPDPGDPELIIDGFSVEPVNSKLGDELTAYISIANLGEADITDSFWVDFYEDRSSKPGMVDGDHYKVIKSLQSGQQKAFYFNFTPGEAGAKQAWLQVDTDKDISDEPLVEGPLAYTVEDSAPGCRVSTPDVPSGADFGVPGELYPFATGGAECEAGHAVQYRFDWGDGSYSDWRSSTNANNSWSVEGTYQVRAQARCAENTAVTSSWSDALSVPIDEPGVADLVAEELTVEPGTSEEGDELTATVVIKNRGDADVKNNFRVDFYEDEAVAPVTGQAGEHFMYDNFISAGETKETTFSFTPDEAGTYRAWVQVDSYEVIGDSDVKGPVEYVVKAPEVDCRVSVPDVPSGIKSGKPGESYTYSTGNAECEAGHMLEYRFYWGDSFSDWSTATEASNSWSAEDSYQVRAQARCAENNEVRSIWSMPLNVTIKETKFDSLLYWQHEGDGRLKAWQMKEETREGTPVFFEEVDAGFEVKGVVDATGNATSDIYLYNRDEGKVKLWLMDGLKKAEVIEITNPHPFRSTIDSVWEMMAVYDLNDSGEPDIIWQAKEGENEGHMAVWLMDGHQAYDAGRIHNHPGEHWVNPAWEIGAVFDLLGDGEPEIIWQAVGGDHADDLAYWKIDMDAPFERKDSARIYNHPGASGINADWNLNASVDLFGDGSEEFIYQHNFGRLVYWQLDVTNPREVIRKDNGFLKPWSTDSPGWWLVGASRVAD